MARPLSLCIHVRPPHPSAAGPAHSQTITLLFAGQDTSAATLSWTMHLLSLPENREYLLEVCSAEFCSYLSPLLLFSLIKGALFQRDNPLVPRNARFFFVCSVCVLVFVFVFDRKTATYCRPLSFNGFSNSTEGVELLGFFAVVSRCKRKYRVGCRCFVSLFRASGRV